MNERIKLLRKTLGLNQTDFGEKIGVKQGSVAGYESGARVPLDAVVALICREFNVNETWLRTGEGNMFNQVSRDKQIMDFMGDILKNESDSFRRRFIAALSKLDESEWEVLEKIALELADENKKS